MLSYVMIKILYKTYELYYLIPVLIHFQKIPFPLAFGNLPILYRNRFISLSSPIIINTATRGPIIINTAARGPIILNTVYTDSQIGLKYRFSVLGTKFAGLDKNLIGDDPLNEYEHILL
jgi:hypothetical protein